MIGMVLVAAAATVLMASMVLAEANRPTKAGAEAAGKDRRHRQCR